MLFNVMWADKFGENICVVCNNLDTAVNVLKSVMGVQYGEIHEAEFEDGILQNTLSVMLLDEGHLYRAIKFEIGGHMHSAYVDYYPYDYVMCHKNIALCGVIDGIYIYKFECGIQSRRTATKYVAYTHKLCI